MKFLNLGFDGKYRLEGKPGLSVGNYGEHIDKLLEGVETINGRPANQFTEVDQLPELMELTWSVLEPVRPVASAELIAVDDDTLKWAEQTFDLETQEVDNHFTIYNEDVLKLWEPEIAQRVDEYRLVIVKLDKPATQISPLRERIERGFYINDFELTELVNRALQKKEIHSLLASIGEHYGLSDVYDGQPQYMGVNSAYISELGYVAADIMSVAGTFTESRLHIPTFMLYKSTEEIAKLMDSPICELIKRRNEEIAKEFEAYDRLLESLSEASSSIDWSDLVEKFRK